MEKKQVQKLKLPDAPGVYLFKKGKTILYIGKATSLRDRVRSYFSNDIIKTRGPRIIDMVTQATTVDHVTTDSVLEALILESTLIKKHKPKYNILEKDDKSYAYVVITKEDFPMVTTDRARNLEFEEKIASKYKYVFGPYPHGGQLREALKIIRRIFPFRTGKALSTLYKEMGLEPDTGNVAAKRAYQKNINHIRLFFQGKKKELESALKKEMMQYAKKQQFERADKIKQQLFSLQHIKDVSLLKHENIQQDTEAVRIEAFDVAHQSGQHTVGVMTVVTNGEPHKSQYRKFIIRTARKSDDVGALRELLTRRLKHTEWTLPDIIVIDGGIAQRNVAEKVVREAGLSFSIVNVVKDDKHNPHKFIGTKKIIDTYKKDIILANSEAHRFAISFFRTKQRKELLTP